MSGNPEEDVRLAVAFLRLFSKPLDSDKFGTHAYVGRRGASLSRREDTKEFVALERLLRLYP